MQFQNFQILIFNSQNFLRSSRCVQEIKEDVKNPHSNSNSKQNGNKDDKNEGENKEKSKYTKIKEALNEKMKKGKNSVKQKAKNYYNETLTGFKKKLNVKIYNKLC